MKKVKHLIQILWELPQNLIGFLVKHVCRATLYTTYKDAKVYSWNVQGGISLGRYIFVPYKHVDPTTYQVQQFIKHEYGHTVQSKYLGWFYLLVIGLPSLIWANCFEWYWTKKGKSYYDFFTESSANKLGSVDKER